MTITDKQAEILGREIGTAIAEKLVKLLHDGNEQFKSTYDAPYYTRLFARTLAEALNLKTTTYNG